MAVAAVTGERAGPMFELEALEALPCGCVAVSYTSPRLQVAVVALEAKGPYCIYPSHKAGDLLHLGDAPEEEIETEETSFAHSRP